MKIKIDECYELEGDYQNQFLGNEVFPKPNYKKLKLAERSVNQIHYNDVYLLEPLHYYYVTFDEDLGNYKDDDEMHYLKTLKYYPMNGLLLHLEISENRMYIFNASQNIIYLQKGTVLGEVVR